MMKNPFFKFFSSLKLAVICILTLAVVLAYGTVSESLFGTRAAHVLVYGTWWFMGILTLLGTNVICAALSRYPWKPRQYGFVITHLGIIIILVGSFVTQRFGVDGQLPVLEGNQDNEVILNDLELTVTDEDGNTSYSFPVPETARTETGKLMQVALSPERKLVVDRFIPRAVPHSTVLKSPVPGIGAPALHVEIFNSRFRIDEWMLVSHPEKPVELNMGPAVLSFRQLWSKAEEESFAKTENGIADSSSKNIAKRSKGHLVLELKGKQFRAEVDQAGSGWNPISGTDYELKILRYLPYAIVEKNELVNKSNDPVNPAVQLLIRNRGKQEEKHTVFANFPEFTTIHRAQMKPGQPEFGFKLRFVAGGADGDSERQKLAIVGKSRGQLQFAQSADHSFLLYKVRGADGKIKNQGRAKAGDELATGWMDLKFRVLDWFDAAVQDDTPQSVDYISGQGEMNFQTGLHVLPVEDRQPAAVRESGAWILEGGDKILTLGGHNLSVRYGKTRLTLPFALFLEKFHMGTDPGTTKAATYESRVHIQDPTSSNAEKTSHLISMNEPLVYGGFTFYQASYVMEEGRAPVSVFSVNYDPGRVVKYAGAIIMVIGIILMFYLNPHYWDKLFGNRKKEVKA